MAKLDLATLTSGYLDVSKLNENFAKIEVWADTVISRTGDAPNQMETDLDLNGHSLLNLGGSDDVNALLTYQQMVDYVAQNSSGLIRQTIQRFVATSGQTIFNLTQFSYTPNAGNLAVYLEGVRLFPGFDYTETGPTSITLSVGAPLNSELQVVSNEFIATIALPPHQHPWGQITDVPVYATRWPSYAEVTDKPTTLPPSAHQHATTDITSGSSFADQYRGVFVQSSAPTATRAGDLWFW